MDFPVGIDLVEFKKAASFYKVHRRRLRSLFSQEEADYIRSGNRPHESLALLLGAKEAVFKALGVSWMGPAGFKDIQIMPRLNGKFSLKLKGDFKKYSAQAEDFKIGYSKQDDYLIVHCHPRADFPCVGI